MMTQWWGWGPGVPAGSQSRKAAWTIIPINPEWSDEVAEANLTEKDYSFMNVIAPHENYPGHHLQRLWQNESPRKLRVYEGSYSNQSWCYYIEWELAPNYGFYPKEKQALYELEALRLKLWRMGRVIIDAGLHTGRLSYDDAVQIESERIGFVRRGGQINVDGIASGGSGTAAPTLGYFEWMLLREDYFRRCGSSSKGSLKDFDRVYKIDSSRFASCGTRSSTSSSRHSAAGVHVESVTAASVEHDNRNHPGGEPNAGVGFVFTLVPWRPRRRGRSEAGSLRGRITDSTARCCPRRSPPPAPRSWADSAVSSEEGLYRPDARRQHRLR
jgi:hypothetical protein